MFHPQATADCEREADVRFDRAVKPEYCFYETVIFQLQDSLLALSCGIGRGTGEGKEGTEVGDPKVRFVLDSTDGITCASWQGAPHIFENFSL